MRKTTYVLLAVLALFQLSCQNDYKAEDEIWACIVSEYNAIGIDITTEHQRYEDLLVEQQYLDGNDPAAYLKLCKNFKEVNEILPPPHDGRYMGLTDSFVRRENPKVCADSTLLKQTSIYTMQQKALEVIQSSGDISPTLIADVMLESYSERDMGHPLYRFIFLSSINTFIDPYAGIQRQLPPADDHFEPEVVSERNMVNIELQSDDKILFNGDPIALKKVRTSLMPYLKGSHSDSALPEVEALDIPELGVVESSKVHIYVQSSRKTSYKAYIALQNEIIAAYNQRRNAVSQKYFGVDFETLNDEQQRLIKKVVPMNLSESHPGR